jgi:hypothetical protein
MAENDAELKAAIAAYLRDSNALADFQLPQASDDGWDKLATMVVDGEMGSMFRTLRSQLGHFPSFEELKRGGRDHMTFEVNDKEWRDTVRSHFFHLWGEWHKDIPEDEEGTFHDNDGIEHPFHGKAELIEAMFNNQFKNGFADALKRFYEQFGCYPPLPDLSSGPRLMLR